MTSFADGSKISFEQAIVANATGFKVQARGMSRGVEYSGSIMEIASLYDVDAVRELGGIVDYTSDPPTSRSSVSPNTPIQSSAGTWSSTNSAKGRSTPSGSRTTSRTSRPRTRSLASPSWTTTSSTARRPGGQVCAVAKRDLKADEVLDEYGMYMTYGEATNVDEMSAGQYLPEGLVEGCRLRRDVSKDQVLTYEDVDLPPGRLADRLRAEQYRHFRGETWLEELLTTKV